MTYGRSLERHLKYFGLVDDGGKAITISEWATLAQDRAGWLKLVTKAPFNIGKPQLRPPRCDTRVTPEEKRRFLARWRGVPKRLNNSALSSMQKHTQKRLKSGWKYYASCPLHTILFTILTCAQRTRVHFCPQHWLLTELLCPVSFGFVLVRVRVRTPQSRLKSIKIIKHLI
jgi:hypothetical protein